MSKKKIVEVLALMDRSGSMSGIIHEAVNAFNTFIDEQKKTNIDDTVIVTLASFDNSYEIVFDRININELPKLTVEQVLPRGMTALNDAIGKLVNGAKHPKRPTVLLIQTDGHENASQEFTTPAIKALIEQKQKDGWDVNFIGAGLSKFEVETQATMRGVLLGKAVAFQANAEGMENLKTYYSNTTATYRSVVSAETKSEVN